jgi:hypothetical protein
MIAIATTGKKFMLLTYLPVPYSEGAKRKSFCCWAPAAMFAGEEVRTLDYSVSDLHQYLVNTEGYLDLYQQRHARRRFYLSIRERYPSAIRQDGISDTPLLLFTTTTQRHPSNS